MKFLLLYTVIILSSYHVLSQDIDTTFYEGNQINYCGKIIVFDKVWLNNDTIRADISVLNSENSKPITGGYKMGDAVQINDTCSLFVNLIYKAGFEHRGKDSYSISDGKITLSNAKYVNPKYPKKCEDTLEFYNESKYFVGSYMWSFRDTCIDTNCFIKVDTKKGEEIKSIDMKEGDLLWSGICLYELTDVSYRAVFRKMK